MKNMKAALLHEYGQDLQIEEVSTPEPQAGQVLVRVDTCGVCHSDLHLARGQWPRFHNLISLPIILGHEVTGRITALGPEVQGLAEDDRVGVSWFHHTCDRCENCRRDLEVYCDRPQITGVTVNGGFGEYILAWASHVIPIPDTLSADTVAPLFCAGGTVYSALSKVSMDESKRLAVWGVGGLGHLAVQLGRQAGAQVTAVDLDRDKLELAQRSGARHGVLVEEAAEWFRDPRHQVDAVIVCATAIEAYRSALESLRKGGILLLVGLPAGPLPWGAGDLVRSGARIFPSRVSSRRELRELMDLAAAGAVHCDTATFPLAEINRIFSDLDRGKILGRAVIDFRA